MKFSSFDDVRARLVSEDSPARDEGDMDYERCAALHNAIVKHGWVASGRLLENMPTLTCWEANEAEWQQDADRLQPSVIEFLKRAYDTKLPDTEPIYNFASREYKFFYFLEGLIGPHGSEAYNFEHIEKFSGQYMTLYTPNDRLGSHAYGLIYNQETHECIVNFVNTYFSPEYKTLPWQKLETILSVYIDMIEAGKVVAMSDDVENPDDLKLIDTGGETGPQWISTTERPDALLSDPISGLRRNDEIMFGPWIVQSHTTEVLNQCLETWNLLVEAIEQNMPVTPALESDPQYGLATEEMLERAGVTDTFARELLLRARRPLCAFIAPGLRLPTPEEFIEQPFKSLSTAQSDPEIRSKMPILLFRGEDTCAASKDFPYPYSQVAKVPTGLYLEGWTESDLNPFTDAARLLLPYQIGGEDTWAQTANGVAIDRRHDELYQIGENPFVTFHGVSLLAILQNFYTHVSTEDWSVAQSGINESVDRFRDAETEEHCDKYVVPMGPGDYW